MFAAFLFLTSIVITAQASSHRNPLVEIKCTYKSMKVTINLGKEEDKDVVIYLEKLKGYPSCQPEKTLNKATFLLPLDADFYSCGTTRIQDKLTGTQIFYNKIVLERPSNNTVQTIIPKCIIRHEDHSTRNKRQLNGNEWDLPENFTETVEELIDYSGNFTGSAPIPYLNIGVRQNGQFVDTALNVHPGTPLEMIIYLDEVSAPVYGILARHLKVTDNTPRRQEEVIILEGCSIDPYIFSNFETTDGGDSVIAKFRAFKFPDSNYVLFVGTVNVCLKECLGVLCGNNQLGYGRRKRAIPSLPSDPNKVYEIEMSAFLKVQSMELDGGSILKAVKAQGSFEDERIINRREEVLSDLRSTSRGQSRSLPLRNTHLKEKTLLSKGLLLSSSHINILLIFITFTVNNCL